MHQTRRNGRRPGNRLTAGARLAAAVAVAGCSNGSGASAQSSSGGVSFANEIIPLFESSCDQSQAQCHGDPSVTSGNAWGPARPYLGPSSGVVAPAAAGMIRAGIVGIKSAEDPSMNLVTPGDPSESYLFYKVSWTQGSLDAQCVTDAGCGNNMPSSTTKGKMTQLAPSDLDVLEAWIAEGAPLN